MRYLLASSLALALSCHGAPPLTVVELSPLARRPGVAEDGELQLRLRSRTGARFFPAIGVLHDPGTRGRGRDFLIDAGGHATRIAGDPFASRVGTTFVDVVGDWPRVAWARVALEEGDGPAEHEGQDPAGEGDGDRRSVRRLLEWSEGAWSEATTDGVLPVLRADASEPWPPAGASSARRALPRAAMLALAPWNEDEALTFGVQFSEAPATAPGTRPWEERCDPATQRHLGATEAPPPELRLEGCLFAPHALATSADEDVFLLAQRRLGRPLRKELIAWGPLEVWRWSRGQQAPARDDLASTIGFRPGVLDAWEHRTLLVVSATDAYLAVTSSQPAGPDVPAQPPGGIATAQDGEIVLLHFDGRSWSEALRAPPPWGGIERAADGSIWVVAGARLLVAPPPASPTEPRAFVPVAMAPVRQAGGLRPVVPVQVMPWSSRRASVIGRFGDALGLFTIERADDASPPVAARSASPEARPRAPAPAAAAPPTAEASKTKVMKIRALDSDRTPMPHRPYVMLAGGQWFEGQTDADGNVVVDIPEAADILELIVWQRPPAGSVRWTFDVVEALPPANTPAGARARLRNLAYLQGEDGGDALDEPLARAIRAFQADERIPMTGTLDATTVRALKARHGH